MNDHRPCRCERYRPARAFRPDRDCDKCWLYAHDPDVRQAWGGDAADCMPIPVANQRMAPAELADFISNGVGQLPSGWKHWPVARDAHLLLVDRFLESMPAYPDGKFRGRGAVICGGGRYEASVYVCCRMLRHVGWQYPIQVWHRGAAEPVSELVRRIPGVEVIDTEGHPAREERRVMGGWESKSLAIIHSPFEEVLFLDADTYPIYNPDECFLPENNPHGIVTWPDTPVGDGAVHWGTYGLPADGKAGLNGGHYVFTKRLAWTCLQLAAHFDNHSDFYYWRSCYGVEVGAFSDQEQVRVALHRLGVPSTRYTDRPLVCNHGFYVQAGPNGRPMIVHRFGNKFARMGDFAQGPIWNEQRFPMESIAWNYFLEWMTSSSFEASFPDDVPGWFTRAECGLWRQCCERRDVLELGRYHGRSTVVAAAVANHVVSIDRDSDRPADFWLQRYNLRHKVWIRVGEFAELIPSSGGPFSACLIDGAHDYDSVWQDIENVRPHLAPGSLIGFHDFADDSFPGVQRAVDEAAKLFGLRFIDRADHLGVFETP